MARRSWLAVLALMGLLGAAGCSGDDEPEAQVTGVVVAHPSADEPAPDDPPGTNTCHLLVTAVTDATLMEPGVVDRIVAASSTADAPVADSAGRLASAYATAVAAKGKDNEPDAIAAVSAAGAEMSGVCDDSGLESVG